MSDLILLLICLCSLSDAHLPSVELLIAFEQRYLTRKIKKARKHSFPFSTIIIFSAVNIISHEIFTSASMTLLLS